MRDEAPVQRIALGAACAIFDGQGRVLLVHHTYGRLNWELPGGGAEPGEAPDETARRELLEETGLRAELDRLTGVYFEPDHDFGPMLHCVFRCRWNDRLDPVAASPEVSDVRYWPLDDLPTPISDFTERRIRDAVLEGPVHVGRVVSRHARSVVRAIRSRASVLTRDSCSEFHRASGPLAKRSPLTPDAVAVS